jgi:hypothetical protein
MQGQALAFRLAVVTAMMLWPLQPSIVLNGLQQQQNSLMTCMLAAGVAATVSCAAIYGQCSAMTQQVSLQEHWPTPWLCPLCKQLQLTSTGGNSNSIYMAVYCNCAAAQAPAPHSYSSCTDVAVVKIVCTIYTVILAILYKIAWQQELLDNADNPEQLANIANL